VAKRKRTASKRELEALASVAEQMAKDATRRVMRRRMDQSLYGFCAVDAEGERIDPYAMLDAEHKAMVDHYRRSQSEPCKWLR
jgi:hypothetical protein